MSDTITVALIGAAASVSAVTVSGVIGWFVSRGAKQKIQEIHVLVDGDRLRMENRIAAQDLKIAALQKRIDGSKK